MVVGGVMKLDVTIGIGDSIRFSDSREAEWSSYTFELAEGYLVSR